MFLHPELIHISKYNAEPLYEYINYACVQLNTNVEIHYNSGYGKLRNVFLTVVYTKYQYLISMSIAFINPVAHIFKPIHTIETTIFQTNKINFCHKKDYHLVCKYNYTGNELNQITLKDFGSAYICKLKHAKLRYAQVTTLDISTHLWN